MRHAIRVDSEFATPHDTARTLGVSRSRTEELIKIAKGYTERILKNQDAKSGASVAPVKVKRQFAATAGGKNNGRHAGTKISARSKKTRPKS